MGNPRSNIDKTKIIYRCCSCMTVGKTETKLASSSLLQILFTFIKCKDRFQQLNTNVTLSPQDDRKFSEVREDEGMGTADIKYGDTLVYVQHAKTGHWLSYQTFETKKRGVGRVEEKKVGVRDSAQRSSSFFFSSSFPTFMWGRCVL